MKRILGVMTARWLVSLIGAVALALLVWFAGPLIAVADIHPLEAQTTRLVVVIVILIGWGLINMRSRVQQARTDSQMVASLTEPGPDTAQAKLAADTAEEVQVLRKRLEEALLLLKRSSGGKGARYLYQLPWYMLIGPPGSGKTTALVNSGLSFPLANRYGKDAVKGVGGTRNCDWWLTDEAVLLDTAGRYTTQDSQAALDQGAWRGFLALLKKFRPRQPLNGALVAISIADIATLPAAERLAHARAIRQRLHELQTELGVRFPVYVLFTKADLIAGFVEFFDDLDREGREQVWGMTLPLDTGAQESEAAVAGFAVEFDALVQRLNERLLERIQSEADINKRAAIFGFPNQVASLREPLREFLDEIFMPNRFEGRPLLRGIYLTSGTQEGTPIDRLMGAMAASFGLDRQRVPAFSGQGRSYFLTRLLRGVVFAEAGVVGTDSRVVRRQAWLRRSAYAAAAVVVLACLGGWTASYLGNRRLIAETAAAIADYQKQVAPLATKVIGDGDVDRTLPPLATIRKLTAQYGDAATGAPLGLGFGLYQGEKLGSAADLVYRRALEQVFLPRLLIRAGNRIRASLADPDAVEQGLKVYLMLGGQGPLDKELVKGWMAADWNASFPGPDHETVRAALAQHLDALLAQKLPETTLDAQILDAGRRVLLETPLASRAYAAIKQSATARQLAPWRPSDNAGPAADKVFTRRSGKPLTDGIPGIFTYAGYFKVFLPALATAAKNAAQESWVLGGAAPKGGGAQLASGLERDIAQLYADEYARSWDALLSDVAIVRFRDMAQAADVLNILASPSSPLKTLYTAIAKETDLTRPPDIAAAPGSAAAAATQAASGAVGKAAAALGQNMPSPPAAQQIADRFRPLRDFAGIGVAGPAPIDDFLRQLGDIYGQVSQMAQAAPGAAPRPVPPGSPLANLAGTAARLPAPLAATIAAVSGNLTALRSGNTRSELDSAWKTEVYGFCSKALDNRYPMVRSSTVDVNLDDFARLFKPGGLIDAFFANNLKPFFDTSHTPWRATGDLAVAPDAIAQFQRAAAIRDLFFPNGAAAPQLKFELIPVALDPTVTQALLEINGTDASYSHGPPQPVAIDWPGAKPQQVRLAFTPPQPGQVSSITEAGPWGLFRLFDRGRREDVAGLADRVRITFTLGDRKAVYELRANSVVNALTMKELGEFRCPSHL